MASENLDGRFCKNGRGIEAFAFLNVSGIYVVLGNNLWDRTNWQNNSETQFHKLLQGSKLPQYYVALLIKQILQFEGGIYYGAHIWFPVGYFNTAL